MPLDGSACLPVGGGSVAVYGTPVVLSAGGTSLLAATGAQVRYQLSTSLSVGLDGGAAFLLDNGLVGYSGRLSARYNPSSDNFALRVGLGSWHDTTKLNVSEPLLQFGTLDLGATYSFYTAAQGTEIYIGGTSALGFFLERGSSIEPTGYLGGSLGVLSAADSPLQVGADVSVLAGGCLDGCGNGASIYSGFTLQLRYLFGIGRL